MEKIVSSKAKKVFTLIVILFPVFERYLSPIRRVTLSEFALLIFMIISMALHKKLQCNKVFLGFFIYILFHIGYSATLKTGGGDAAGSALRVAIYYFGCCFFSVTYFDFKIGIRALEIVSFILSIYAIIQFILSFVHVFPSTYLPLLPHYSNYDFDAAISAKDTMKLQFRASSFLSEPSTLATYLSLALIAVLFYDKNRYSIVLAAFFSGVILITYSSIGIVSVGLIWIIYFLKNNKEKSIKKIITMCIIAMVGIIVISKTNIWDYFVNHTFGQGISVDGLTNSSRFANLRFIQAEMTDLKSIIFGKGMGQVGYYLPGYARLFYQTGIIGLGLMIIQQYRLLRHCKEKVSFTIIYIVLNIGSALLLGYFSIVFNSFIISYITSESDNLALRKQM